MYYTIFLHNPAYFSTLFDKLPLFSWLFLLFPPHLLHLLQVAFCCPPLFEFLQVNGHVFLRRKTGHKAKICGWHILPSSIEAGSSNVWQCSQIVLPTRTTIQGPFVPALEPVRRKSGAQGELCLRALFTLSYSRKALELFGSAPNIYFLSRALRPARMVSWLFVWGG